MRGEADPYGFKTRAVAYAIRQEQSDEMAHKFLETVCARGVLGMPECFPRILAELVAPEPVSPREPTMEELWEIGRRLDEIGASVAAEAKRRSL